MYIYKITNIINNKIYAAKIKINGKKKSLGYYSTKEEASAVYNLALYNKLREYIG